MVLICLTSMIFLVLFYIFSLLQVTGSCNDGKNCENPQLNSIERKWCCKADEICGENYEQCKVEPTIQLFTILYIILIMIIIGIFLGRCLIICHNCRNELNENLSNNISQVIYQPIVITDFNIPIPEPPAPSYEEVMRNNNSYQLESAPSYEEVMRNKDSHQFENPS